jgi:hypothetical protein
MEDPVRDQRRSAVASTLRAIHVFVIAVSTALGFLAFVVPALRNQYLGVFVAVVSFGIIRCAALISVDDPTDSKPTRSPMTYET